MTPQAKPLPPRREVPCTACGGRGIISVGPDDVTCDACGGTGKITVSDGTAKPNP